MALSVACYIEYPASKGEGFRCSRDGLFEMKKKRLFVAAVGCLVVIAAAVVWWTGRPSRSVTRTLSPRPGREEGAVDVLLVVIDTERADYTSAYGATRPTTPFMARLAAEGVMFERAFSPAPWTLPAMISMVTGIYPSEHGMMKKVDATEDDLPSILSEQAITLAEYLSEHGYSTFGINTNFVLQSKFGFGQGFDRFVGENFAFLPFPNMALDSLLSTIHGSSKYFTWIHYFDPHQPYKICNPWFAKWNESAFRSNTEMVTDYFYRVYRHMKGLGPNAPAMPEDLNELQDKIVRGSTKINVNHVYREMRKMPEALTRDYRLFLKAGYQGDIRRTDEAMESAFARLGVDDQTLVVVTSDHGEELLDHGDLGHHGNSLYQELLHVPLIIRLPGGARAGTVIDTPVSTLDLLPTILDLLHLPVPDDLSGVSLAPLIGGEELEPRPLFAEVNSTAGNACSITEFPWKYIHYLKPDEGALYNLDNDSREKRNLVEREKARARAMRERLLDWKQKIQLRWPDSQQINLSPKEIKKLKAMGYMR